MKKDIKIISVKKIAKSRISFFIKVFLIGKPSMNI